MSKRDQLVAKLLKLKQGVNKSLIAAKVDKRDLEGKTISEVVFDWDTCVLAFDDGTYFSIGVITCDEAPQLTTSSIDAFKGKMLGFITPKEFQALKDAEEDVRIEITREHNDRNGVIELNNAIANLGLDAVKKLVGG